MAQARELKDHEAKLMLYEKEVAKVYIFEMNIIVFFFNKDLSL